MGEDLAEELLADYEGNLNGKRLGIVAQSLDTQAGMNRRDGFCETIQDAGAEIVWTVSGLDLDNGEELLNAQTRADIVVALDNNSLVAAGSSANSGYLRGAVIYGIGHSADAVYYLDTGAVEALVIPDEFQQGYQSVAEIAKRLKNRFYRMETVTVEHTVLRREDLFSKENQEMLFMMSQ
jgi:ribose transport system substrate-binding protein